MYFKRHFKKRISLSRYRVLWTISIGFFTRILVNRRKYVPEKKYDYIITVELFSPFEHTQYVFSVFRIQLGRIEQLKLPFTRTSYDKVFFSNGNRIIYRRVLLL